MTFSLSHFAATYAACLLALLTVILAKKLLS